MTIKTEGTVANTTVSGLGIDHGISILRRCNRLLTIQARSSASNNLHPLLQSYTPNTSSHQTNPLKGPHGGESPTITSSQGTQRGRKQPGITSILFAHSQPQAHLHCSFLCKNQSPMQRAGEQTQW